MAATLGEVIQGLISDVERHTRGGASYATAEGDLRQLRGMLAAYEHYSARRQKECVEAWGGTVQHDAPTLSPAADASFTRYLAQGLLATETDPRVDATAVAAGSAAAHGCIATGPGGSRATRRCPPAVCPRCPPASPPARLPARPQAWPSSASPTPAPSS